MPTKRKAENQKTKVAKKQKISKKKPKATKKSPENVEEPLAEEVIVAIEEKKEEEKPPKKTPDLFIMKKSRYYDLFLEWLNCCREYDPEKIIGEPFEENLYKAFKSIFQSLQIIMDDPKQIKSINFKQRGIQIIYRSPIEWKYPKGNELIYDPDQVINQIKNYYDNW